MLLGPLSLREKAGRQEIPDPKDPLTLALSPKGERELIVRTVEPHSRSTEAPGAGSGNAAAVCA
jgi:hypothetical protein